MISNQYILTNIHPSQSVQYKCKDTHYFQTYKNYTLFFHYQNVNKPFLYMSPKRFCEDPISFFVQLSKKVYFCIQKTDFF